MSFMITIIFFHPSGQLLRTQNILSSDKYADVYAEIKPDESMNETGIALRYEPEKGGGFFDSYRQKKDDHCPACFRSSILTMSSEYFENLKQLITDEATSTLI
jgi:hypothetical protein